MKRSEINSIMKDALELFKEYKICLPDFVLWTPEEWKTKGDEVQEIKDNMLGWDITDYGHGDFYKTGLFLLLNNAVARRSNRQSYSGDDFAQTFSGDDFAQTFSGDDFEMRIAVLLCADVYVYVKSKKTAIGEAVLARKRA